MFVVIPVLQPSHTQVLWPDTLNVNVYTLTMVKCDYVSFDVVNVWLRYSFYSRGHTQVFWPGTLDVRTYTLSIEKV